MSESHGPSDSVLKQRRNEQVQISSNRVYKLPRRKVERLAFLFDAFLSGSKFKGVLICPYQEPLPQRFCFGRVILKRSREVASGNLAVVFDDNTRSWIEMHL